MRYFSRVRDPLQGKVWNLFGDILNLPKRNLEKGIPTLEILRAASTGAIHLNDKFSLAGYSYSTRSREEVKASIEGSKFLSLQGSTDKETSHPTKDGVTEEDLSFFGRSRYTTSRSVDDDMSIEFKRNLSASELSHLSQSLRGELLFDLETCVMSAIQGHKKAIQNLSQFVAQYPEHSSTIEDFIRDHLGE